jgi:hypothetical protein
VHKTPQPEATSCTNITKASNYSKTNSTHRQKSALPDVLYRLHRPTRTGVRERFPDAQVLEVALALTLTNPKHVCGLRYATRSSRSTPLRAISTT